MLRTGLLAMVAVMAGLGLVGCSGEPRVSDADVIQLSHEELLGYIAEGSTALLDVRKPELYEAGHIPGAINIFSPELRRRDSRLDGAKRIVVYGGGWTDPLAVNGAKRLIALGYKNVHEYKGGIELWEDSGGQLVSTKTATQGRPEAGQ